MNRYLSLSFLIMLSLGGCSPRHYFIRDDGMIDLYLKDEKAKEVLFASSMDDFRMHRPRKRGDHLWVMEGLANREFRYFYMVNDKVYVPDCPCREADDFGRQNCIYQPPNR